VDTIDKLIINSAFCEPKYHWSSNTLSRTFKKVEGRRPAGFFIVEQKRNEPSDMGEFRELPLVNLIRERVKAWRELGYPGVTGVTQRLLEHWNDGAVRINPFFWCQLDAIETLIWLVEVNPTENDKIEIPSDDGDFKRICTKLCTGGGKTIVMAMLIAWQVCNKVVYPQDNRFSKYIFIVAPNLTVRDRLSVLRTGGTSNYYRQFDVIPVGMYDKLNRGRVMINNWQALAWDSEETIAKRKSVDKRGCKSDEAYVHEILSDMREARQLLVINDEAHHAWRFNPHMLPKSLSLEEKKEIAEATVWVNGLDRIHRVRGILTCYDFSATPYVSTGHKIDEDGLFKWIVSDFGLNDGIESGLVKTPRVVVRDDALADARTMKSRLYHLYNDKTVKDDLGRKKVEPSESLPTLVLNAYYLLGKDWQITFDNWKKAGCITPPVMITVANSTSTAARVKYTFDKKVMPLGNISELCLAECTVHIDTRVMDSYWKSTEPTSNGESDGSEEDEVSEEKDTQNGRLKRKKEAVALLRERVNTVGQIGKSGEQVRNVISVGMLSEGWDAKTVTHIMGLRAFTSQLLCEQVIGRGLRRTSYDLEDGSEFFTPEYVNIFGIPFAYLPHETDESTSPPIVKPKTQIEACPSKIKYIIGWPNVVRINRVYKPVMTLDMSQIPTLTLDAAQTPLRADLAPFAAGHTILSECNEINLEKLDAVLRMQKIIFEATGQVYDIMASQGNTTWQRESTKYALLGQVFHWVERVINSDIVKIDPPLFNTTPLRRRLMMMLNMNRIVQHIWGFIKVSQTEYLLPELDISKRMRTTADMQTWYTSKICFPTTHSHISHVVCDSSWEATESYILGKNPDVVAWAKNDHLGFEIYYVFEGVVRKYYPDFLVKLSNKKTLVLETKGQPSPQSEAKKEALQEWVMAVNTLGEYGQWCSDESQSVADVDGVIQRHMG